MIVEIILSSAIVFLLLVLWWQDRRRVESLATADRVPGLENELSAISAKNVELIEQNAILRAKLAGLESAHLARLEDIHGLKQELDEKFTKLAGGVLNSNSENFLKLVSERFEKHRGESIEDLEKRHTAIKNLVEPLDKKLTNFDQKIEEVEKVRREAAAAITTQVNLLSENHASLRQETGKLVTALRAPKTRGRWGEMQLKQVFELAGMVEHVSFNMERSIDVDGGKQRPDAIVNIPGGKSIVVDAKTPLEAYLDSIEADTPEARDLKLSHHAKQVRNHVQMLSSKSYQDALDSTPDFVVMFIPGESFVAAAAEADPELIEYAFRKKILIATPTTLMALVKAIAYGWQQEKMAENAVEVQKTARELYDRLSTFASHLSGVGRSLSSSVSNYNKAIASLEGRVMPSARKFESMGVVATGTELPKPERVEAIARPIVLQELESESENLPDP